MWYFYSQGIEKYFEKYTDLLRANMSENYFSVYYTHSTLYGDVGHHHLKRTNFLILQTQSMKQDYFLFIQHNPYLLFQFLLLQF